MSMVEVGESLDQSKTLTALARPREKQWAGDECRSCHTNGHPRGFSQTSRLCWYCASPNVGPHTWKES